MSNQTTLKYGTSTILFNEDPTPKTNTEGLFITRVVPNKEVYYLFDENSIRLGQPFFAVDSSGNLTIFSLIYTSYTDEYHLIKCEDGETAFIIKAVSFSQCIQRLNGYIFEDKFSINPAEIESKLNALREF